MEGPIELEKTLYIREADRPDAIVQINGISDDVLETVFHHIHEEPDVIIGTLLERSDRHDGVNERRNFFHNLVLQAEISGDLDDLRDFVNGRFEDVQARREFDSKRAEECRQVAKAIGEHGVYGALGRFMSNSVPMVRADFEVTVAPQKPKWTRVPSVHDKVPEPDLTLVSNDAVETGPAPEASAELFDQEALERETAEPSLPLTLVEADEAESPAVDVAGLEDDIDRATPQIVAELDHHNGEASIRRLIHRMRAATGTVNHEKLLIEMEKMGIDLADTLYRLALGKRDPENWQDGEMLEYAGMYPEMYVRLQKQVFKLRGEQLPPHLEGPHERQVIGQ